MSLGIIGVMVLAGFAVCAWSGRILAHHYQDRLEVAAILAVAGCVLGSLVITGSTETGSVWPQIVLALAMSAGLFAGYIRSGWLS